MMRVYNGSDYLYQWDLNQKVTSNSLKVGDEVHFSNMSNPTALITIAYELDGVVVADIPNILLQKSYPITVYSMLTTDDINITTDERQITVRQRAKPDDYIYTETEVKTYNSLDSRMRKIEEGYSTYVNLTDRVTGKKYCLYVNEGKLSMREV